MDKLYYKTGNSSNLALSALVYKTPRVPMSSMVFVTIPLDFPDVVSLWLPLTMPVITAAFRSRVSKLYLKWPDSKYVRLCRPRAGMFFNIAAVSVCFAVCFVLFCFYNP